MLLEWIKVKTRPLTEEEKADNPEEYEFMYDCELPYNNQEVLITSKYGYVTQTTFYSDYGCYFEDYEDEDDVLAWMPLPEPYKAGGKNEQVN